MENISVNVKTCEMHTGGDPVRIVESGFPIPLGHTILDKMRYIKENVDMYRKLVMQEPRGHADMYGALLVHPDIKDSDIAVIFMHNDGYSSTCSQATLALGRYAVDYGFVRNPSGPEVKVSIQVPSGPVEAYVEYDNGKTGNTRFVSVPSFVFQSDVTLGVPGYGRIKVDIAYGGAFFAFVVDREFNFDLNEASVDDIRQAALATSEALKKQITISHPTNQDLAILTGTIITDGENTDAPSWNICVLANGQVCRAPCGSGVIARTALMYQKKMLCLGQEKIFQGLIGSEFKAKPVQEVTYHRYQAVKVELSGRGFYTGSSTFSLENDDVIGQGFSLR